MNPDKRNLRNVRVSYFKNNTYEKNKRKNSERLQHRRIYGYDEDSDTNENLNISNSINNKRKNEDNENFGIYENNDQSDTGDNSDEKYERNENYESDVENLNSNHDNEHDDNSYNTNSNNNRGFNNNRNFNRNYYNGNNYYSNNRRNIFHKIKDFLRNIYRGNEAILVILFIFTVIYFSKNYYLFDKFKRIGHFKIKNKESVVNTIIFINIMIYLLWVIAHYLERSGRVRLLHFLQNNFTSSWTNTIQHKRYWTLFTDSFSHENLGHITGNMFTLYSFSFMVNIYLY